MLDLWINIKIFLFSQLSLQPSKRLSFLSWGHQYPCTLAMPPSNPDLQKIGEFLTQLPPILPALQCSSCSSGFCHEVAPIYLNHQTTEFFSKSKTTQSFPSNLSLWTNAQDNSMLFGKPYKCKRRLLKQLFQGLHTVKHQVAVGAPW